MAPCLGGWAFVRVIGRNRRRLRHAALRRLHATSSLDREAAVNSYRSLQWSGRYANRPTCVSTNAVSSVIAVA
jgi:hypothetical protein